LTGVPSALRARIWCPGVTPHTRWSTRNQSLSARPRIRTLGRRRDQIARVDRAFDQAGGHHTRGTHHGAIHIASRRVAFEVGWAPSGPIHSDMLLDALPSLPLDHDQVRARLVRRGLALSVVALVVVSVEAGVSLSAGVAAGSVALLGYGVDSVIEFVSGLASLWRLAADGDAAKRVRAERLTSRVIGACFLALVLYVLVDASVTIVRHVPPRPSVLGIAVAILSLIAMPVLARAKRRVAVGLESRALRGDAAQSSLCAYLSAILLGGLALNALAGWWWADPVSALLMAPIIGQEGIRTLRGKATSSGGCCAVAGSQ
jgi:hypothetical protein